MRRLFLLSMLFIFCLSGINAQYKKNEIELGIGLWNLNEIINTATDIIISSVPQQAEMANGNSLGSIHVGYKYRPFERLGVGGLFAFDYAYADAMLHDQKIGKFVKHHYTLAAEVDYIYLNFEKFKMYALGGVGGTIYNLNYLDDVNSNENDSNNIPYFTFQITPIGIKYGERFGGFLEVGFGYRGILNAGVFVRF